MRVDDALTVTGCPMCDSLVGVIFGRGTCKAAQIQALDLCDTAPGHHLSAMVQTCLLSGGL